jgi:hypothetical protein
MPADRALSHTAINTQALRACTRQFELHPIGMRRSVENAVSMQNVHPIGMHPWRTAGYTYIQHIICHKRLALNLAQQRLRRAGE